jgi:methyl-accepting chemotaxis protein
MVRGAHCQTGGRGGTRLSEACFLAGCDYNNSFTENGIVTDKDIPARGPLKLTRRFKIQVLLFTLSLVICSLAAASALIYFTTSQELGKGFFTAHRDLRNIWKSLLPAILVITGGVAIIACGVALLGLRRFRRRLEQADRVLLDYLDKIGRGNLNVAVNAERAETLRPAMEALDDGLESFRGHIQEIKGISGEVHRAVMRLNYLAYEEGEITLGELRNVSSNLNTLSRELNNSLKWFEA